VDFDYNLESYPLEIKTNTELKENEPVIVVFKSSNGDMVGGFVFHVELDSNSAAILRYRISYCKEDLTTIPNVPSVAAVDAVWTLTLTRDTQIKLKIKSKKNAKENILVLDSTCTYSGWEMYWNRKISKIQISSNGASASFDYYYKPEPGN
jgi:hypothetical protein